MNKNDKRFLYTERLLRDTYCIMAEELGADKITVAELCRRANINRGTFYLHYNTCDELLETIGREYAERLAARLNGMFNSERSLHESATELLQELIDDQTAAFIMFANGKTECFDLMFRELRETILQSWLERSALSRTEAELVYEYIIGGCYAAVKLVSSTAADSAQACSLLFRLISRGLSSVVDGLPTV